MVQKIKPLMPSLREKKRYLAFEIIADKESFSYKHSADAINTEFIKLFGTHGMAQAGVLILKNQFENNKGIIRVSNKHLDKLRLALAMIKKINKKDVIVKSIIASGMIKKAKESI
ncbi:hypothetical protein GOV08_05535 [Candidatus Woesearchaeota archaeon]|nr:hypothetical protein [Candidatus Woesearchaeota archaeon]